MTLTSRLRVPILVSLAVMLLGMVVALVKSGWFAPQASSPGHVETRPQPAAHRAPGHTQVETPANPPGHDGLKRKAFASPLPPYTVKLPPLGSMPSKVIYCPFCPSRYGKFDRLARIKQAGGTPDIDDAVLKALQHLKQTQRVDGSWSGGPAMTALAVLAYYGQGEGVISADIGDSCLDAIFSLVKLGKKNKDRKSVV